MIVFASPWVFVLLPVPLLVSMIFPAYREPRMAIRVPWFDRLTRLSAHQPAEAAAIADRGLLGKIFLSVVWLLVLTALARPQYLEEPVYKTVPTRDLLLLVDLSGSMKTQDFSNEAGQTTDRLTAVKEILADFLVRREGDRVGLVVFGSGAFVQVPFTQDLRASRLLLNETVVGMAGPKTALGDAMGLGITLFEESTVKERVMIVLTDGNDTASLVPPAEAARIAQDADITVHTIAIGDPEAAGEEKIDEQALEDVSRITGGQFFRADNRDELEKIYATLDTLEGRKIEQISHSPRQDIFHLPLAIAFILSIVFHVRLPARP